MHNNVTEMYFWAFAAGQIIIQTGLNLFCHMVAVEAVDYTTYIQNRQNSLTAPQRRKSLLGSPGDKVWNSTYHLWQNADFYKCSLCYFLLSNDNACESV